MVSHGQGGALRGRTAALSIVPLRLLAAGLVLCALCVTWLAGAEEASVPPSVQATLIGKVAGYDKNFLQRAGERARVLIVTARGDVDSSRMGRQLQAALGEIDRIGGLPHEEVMIEYADAPSLASACRDQHAAIVYLTVGMGRELEAIGKALDGVSTLTVGAVGGYAAKGAVIDLFSEGGKPKITLNLPQARKQQVALAPEVVRIMRVIE